MSSVQIPLAIYGRDWGPRILCAVGCVFSALLVFGLASWWWRVGVWGGLLAFAVFFFRREGHLQLLLFEDRIHIIKAPSLLLCEIFYQEIVFLAVPLGSSIVLRLRDDRTETLSLWHKGDLLQSQILSQIRARGGLLVQKQMGVFEVVWA